MIEQNWLRIWVKIILMRRTRGHLNKKKKKILFKLIFGINWKHVTHKNHGTTPQTCKRACCKFYFPHVTVIRRDLNTFLFNCHRREKLQFAFFRALMVGKSLHGPLFKRSKVLLCMTQNHGLNILSRLSPFLLPLYSNSKFYFFNFYLFTFFFFWFVNFCVAFLWRSIIKANYLASKIRRKLMNISKNNL